jgi:hypothetical protein
MSEPTTPKARRTLRCLVCQLTPVGFARPDSVAQRRMRCGKAHYRGKAEPLAQGQRRVEQGVAGK